MEISIQTCEVTTEELLFSIPEYTFQYFNEDSFFTNPKNNCPF